MPEGRSSQAEAKGRSPDSLSHKLTLYFRSLQVYPRGEHWPLGYSPHRCGCDMQNSAIQSAGLAIAGAKFTRPVAGLATVIAIVARIMCLIMQFSHLL
jgi:hypothetical protein